jgi:hypothetical protein
MASRAGTDRRGVVIVEAAFVAPLLLLIVFGIVEMALLMRDDNALSAVVREGGRSAASAVVDEPTTLRRASQFCASPSCSPDRAPAWADAVATAIGRADGTTAGRAIEELWIYEANAEGYPGRPGTTAFRSCVTECLVYRWSEEHQTFDYVSGSWSTDAGSDCADAHRSVGVYARRTHSFLSGIFSSGVEISDHAVFSLAAACGSVTG